MLSQTNTTLSGESSLPKTDVTGTGAVVQGSSGGQATVENSTMPLKPHKRDTTPTKQLDAAQELEIFVSTFSRMIKAGLQVRVAEFYEGGTVNVIVVLENCKLYTEGGKKRIVMA